MDHRSQAFLRPQHHRQRSLSVSRSGYTATSCVYCGCDFGDIYERRAHESDHFVEPEYRVWQCDLCRRRFSTSVAVEQHIHSKHTTCRFCASRKENSAPIRSSGELFCGDCDRSFADILAFLQHDHATHVSCRHCQQIGRTSQRADFDRHCCGCDIRVTDDNQLEEHYRENPTHYHGHPGFEPKQSSGSLGLPQSALRTTGKSIGTQRPHLTTAIPNIVQVSLTPATPTEDDEQAILPTGHAQARPPIIQTSRYGLPPPTSLSSTPPMSAPRFVCSECRIPFPDAAVLGRHQSFSFNLFRKCNMVFVCPFSMLRHVEMGRCCQWSVTPTVASSRSRRTTQESRSDDSVRMQDA